VTLKASGLRGLCSLRRLLAPLSPCTGLLLSLLLLEQSLAGLSLALLLTLSQLLGGLLLRLSRPNRLHRLGPGLTGWRAGLIRAHLALLALCRAVGALLRAALDPLGDVSASLLPDIAF
jgi:hypothetical protein